METDSQCPQKWENLPENILLKLFSLLEESDIVRASSACRRWRRMFYEPKFWRSVTFDLNSDFHAVKEKALPKIIQTHLLTIGTFVEHLTIVCPAKTFLAPGHFAECVIVILDTLSKNNVFIQTFQLTQIRMALNWKGLGSLKCDLINALCNFIQCQTSLRILVISEALLPTEYGHRVMSSLVKCPSVDSLQQLDISFLYLSYVDSTPHYGEFVLLVLRKCHKLDDIKISCVGLRGSQVHRLCASRKPRVKRLHYKPSLVTEEGQVLGFDDPSQSIRDQLWRKVTKFCPDLRVLAELHVNGDEPFLCRIAVVPVCDLTLVGIGAPPGDRKTLSRILRKLTKRPLRKLESVTLLGHRDVFFFCGKRSNYLRDLVLTFLENHPKVTSLRISEKLMNRTLLEDIKSKLALRYHGNRNVISII